MTEENPGNPQLGGRLMKAVQPGIASNGVPYLKMKWLESHNTSGRKEEKDGACNRVNKLDSSHRKDC